MVILRGEIWWAELPDPVGSTPGYRRPVIIIQSDNFNRSRINTVIVCAVTSNLNLSNAPGNVLLSKKQSRLPKESVVNVSQVITIDKAFLSKKITSLLPRIIKQIDEGLRKSLSL